MKKNIWLMMGVVTVALFLVVAASSVASAAETEQNPPVEAEDVFVDPPTDEVSDIQEITVTDVAEDELPALESVPQIPPTPTPSGIE